MGVVQHTLNSLDQFPTDVYLLRELEEQIRQLAIKYDDDLLRFLDFFYTLLRHHLWVHIASDSSVIVHHSQIRTILTTVSEGLKRLAVSFEDRGGTAEAVLSALVDLVNEYQECLGGYYHSKS